MKIIGFILMMLFPFYLVSAQTLSPYVLGIETTENVSTTKVMVAEQLKAAGIHVIGQYQPADDENRWVMVFTSKEMDNAVKTIGGLTGFAGALRLSVTHEAGKTLVTYTNPVYWGNAYFRDDFPKVASNYAALTTKLEKAMSGIGAFVGTPFGSKKGLELDKLRKYHYMAGMPRFDETKELAVFESHEAALAQVEASIKIGVPNVKMVYKHKIPGQNLTLYGFALSGEDGEGKFMPIIDISNPMHTAFLPYEILVKDNEVHMLHGRFRIALSFPDLKMMTFMKIMSTPGDIEDMMKQLVQDEL